ncbi:LacI family DNA-binding transcriptional regulator [Deinococcus cellulosilyticus]|uniref:LacI family transcriptional regulator n=1 Tax=Deinococcus cellulosilyticus (strain DSM 18568 / NBRC 106333 / KACC 11606 / 5516J-15) TaxID=1223518 RepID=A0A511MWU7_DEIC1|nr:substrate-binding domain-containing protein [Deinococcus cellulosilyticus]GEM45053.1 LacI family transcriptional regulator [Deinococcus cellulosilyticus NBRC 106333 = KACC 11606]
MKKKVTLLDVAQAAGVSPSTVSRIVAGTARVSEKKRQQVEEAIQQLKYQPNLVAKGLVQGRTLSIGVLTQDIASPFYGAALLGIQEALRGTEYVPVFMDGHWKPEDEALALQRLIGRVDGLIIMGGHLEGKSLSALAESMPIVTIGRTIPGFEQHCATVDNYAGARNLVRYLFDLGHRRIAHISGPDDHVDARERLRGYYDAHKDFGMDIDPKLVVQGDFQEASGSLAVATLLESRTLFTAIFAANDQMAYGARLALYRRGIRVPEEVSLVGFDDTRNSEYMMPPLTTVRQPMHELGLSAATALLKMLNDEEVQLEKITPQLVIRESAARAR